MFDIDDFDDIFRNVERIIEDSYTGGYSRQSRQINRMIDVLEDDDHIYITAEIRIPEEDISVEVEEMHIIFNVMDDGAWQRKIQHLPCKVNKDTAKITYNNCIIDIILEKKVNDGETY